MMQGICVTRYLGHWKLSKFSSVRGIKNDDGAEIIRKAAEGYLSFYIPLAETLDATESKFMAFEDEADHDGDFWVDTKFVFERTQDHTETWSA
jgi:hypothetical protein